MPSTNRTAPRPPGAVIVTRVSSGEQVKHSTSPETQLDARPAETLAFTVRHAARPRPQRVYLYFDFEGVAFPAPGDYRVDIALDGRTARQIPLEVILAPSLR